MDVYLKISGFGFMLNIKEILVHSARNWIQNMTGVYKREDAEIIDNFKACEQHFVERKALPI